MKDNKLIAEFMGLETPDGVYFEYLTKDGERSKLTHFMLLEYHLSWDWLMPVANEIIKSRDEQNADWDLTDLKYALCTTNIEYVYKAVVEFIKN
tara:strand:- start:4518 stop:4799 length:282 start_codon:yes stop_codon:yes gene_type:complete